MFYSYRDNNDRGDSSESRNNYVLGIKICSFASYICWMSMFISLSNMLDSSIGVCENGYIKKQSQAGTIYI